MSKVLAYVGLGSNLDDPLQQIEKAVAALDALPLTKVRRQSSRYCTAPWGMAAQPDFINAVVELETSLNADDLLDALLDVERKLGRRRDGERWGPRVIDLDLLLHGDQSLRSDRLELPHPRMADRAFVLVPLAEIACDLEIPGLGTAAERLAMIDTSTCRML